MFLSLKKTIVKVSVHDIIKEVLILVFFCFMVIAFYTYLRC